MNVHQLDGFFGALIAGPETVMPKHARGPAVDLACKVSSVVLNVMQQGPGVREYASCHGQERDQFPKVNRAFSLLGLWHRSFAAGDSLCSLRLPRSMKLVDVEPDALSVLLPLNAAALLTAQAADRV
jgi:hypothetical protein